MGKLALILCFILSVFPADANENRKHIHVVKRGSKKSHRGHTVAKIWIEENGQKKKPITWIIISHQTAQIYKLCDYVHFLSKGNLIESGTADDIFLHSHNPIVHNFMRTQLIECENKKVGQTI